MRRWGPLVLVAFAACGGESVEPPAPPGTPEPPDPSPYGDVAVTVTTTGIDPDLDGYSILIGQELHRIWSTVTPDTFTVPVGDWPVSLVGVAGNCAAVGPVAESIRVTAGATASIQYAVECALATTRAVVFTRETAPGLTGIQVRHPGGRIEVLTSGHADDLPAWSPDGKTIAFLRQASSGKALFFMDRDGANQRQVGPPIPAHQRPVWSPDGTRLVFEAGDLLDPDIYLVDADGSGFTNLVHDPGNDRTPSWSPDGTRIAFASDRSGKSRVYILTLATGEIAPLTQAGLTATLPAWSPDGAWIVHEGRADPCIPRECGLSRVYLLSPDGSGLPQRLDTSEPLGFAWSPDGKHLACLVAGTIGIHHPNPADGFAVPGGPGVRAYTQAAWAPGEQVLLNDGHVVLMFDPRRGTTVTLIEGGLGRDPGWGPQE